MPQHSYQIETKTGKFQVDSDRPLNPQELSEYASKAEKPEGYLTGVGNELLDQGKGVLELGGALKDVVTNAFTGGPAVQSAMKEGAVEGMKEGAKSLVTNPMQLDPTGASQLLDKKEGASAKLGRATVLGVESLLPFAKKLSGIGKAGKAARMAKLATETQHGLPLLGGPVSEVGAQEAMLGARESAPKPKLPTMSAPTNTPPGALGLSPNATPGANTVRGTTGPAIQMSVPARVVTEAAAREAPIAAQGVGEANALARAEQEAAGIKPPSRPPLTDLRAEARSPSPSIDKAYEQVRKEIQRKAEVAAAREKLGVGKKKPEVPVAAPETPSIASEPIVELDKPSPKFPEAGQTGFSKTKTTSLADMKAKYGSDEAAKRAGMSVSELEARIEAQASGKPVEEVLSKRIGATKTNRALGTELPTTGRLPQEAVERIEADIKRKLAAGEKLNDKDVALRARIAKERKEGGFASPKLLAPLGGAAAGGALAAGMDDSGDPGTKLGKGLAGAAGGALAGMALLNPQRAFQIALKARTEGFLSGGAIPKNIMTAVGAPFSATLESIGKGKTFNPKPVKELFRLPTNFKEMYKDIKNPASTNKYGSIAGPFSRGIGAIDTTATKILERGGIPKTDIDRHLLTGNRSLFKGMEFMPGGQAAADIIYPFQRVPANMFAETMEGGGRTLGLGKGANNKATFNPRAPGAFLNPDMRTALDIVATTGGAGLGEWAKGDKKKLYLATIAMALMGGRAGLGTIGAMSQVGRQAIGGVSPIPEQGADLKSLVGFPPSIFKVAQKLQGK